MFNLEFVGRVQSTGAFSYPLMGQLITEDVGHLDEFKEMDAVFRTAMSQRRPDQETLREMCRRMSRLQEALERRVRRARAACN